VTGRKPKPVGAQFVELLLNAADEAKDLRVRVNQRSPNHHKAARTGTPHAAPLIQRNRRVPERFRHQNRLAFAEVEMEGTAKRGHLRGAGSRGRSGGADRNPTATPDSSAGYCRRRPHSPAALPGVIFAPAPDLCEVFVVEIDPKTDARPAQKIEKPDARQTEHLGRFANGDSIVGVELEDSLLFDRTNKFGFGPLVDGAVGNLKLDLQFHGTFIVPL